MNRFFPIMSATVIAIYAAPAMAQDIPQNDPVQRVKRVVEKIPSRAARTDNIYRVSAAKTPSGFPVPRYVSLKVGKVNGRKGPSRQHPIAWQYRRKGLPLVVVAETEMWRKVRDVTGDESWVHKPALSGLRRVLVLEDATLHSKAKDTGRVTATTKMIGAKSQLPTGSKAGHSDISSGAHKNCINPALIDCMCAQIAAHLNVR